MTRPFFFSYHRKCRQITLMNHMKEAEKVNACCSPTNLTNTASAISSRDWQMPTQDINSTAVQQPLCRLSTSLQDENGMDTLDAMYSCKNNCASRADVGFGGLFLFLCIFLSLLTHFLFSSHLISQGIQKDQSNLSFVLKPWFFKQSVLWQQLSFQPDLQRELQLWDCAVHMEARIFMLQNSSRPFEFN